MSKDSKKKRDKTNREICQECTEEPRYYRSQFRTHKDLVKLAKENKFKRLWELMGSYSSNDTMSIQQHIVKHVEYNLARTRCNMDNNSCYQAVAYSVRDRLIESGNDTRKHHLLQNPKRAFYFSIEYLPGRALKNALLNLDIQDNYKTALKELGYKLEELYEEEQDPGLGNGGLGRLASCFLDSLATQEYPVWGYGIRYNYGIFKQKIVDGAQCEVPDYWLSDGYPWEIKRTDVGFRIRFYGRVVKKKDEEDGKEKTVWEDGEEVHAVAYDQLVPGFDTFNTITLRLWRSMPTKEFDFESFNLGDYYKALQDKQKAEFISSVLYPNDATDEGKELRLKQQYFFVSASLQDILRRYRFTNDDWDHLPDKTAIQLNDTHPTLAIVELMRLLVDLEGLAWDHAWGIVTKIFSYTNHTVMAEALESWGEEFLGHLLPRHLQLIQIINEKFLQEARKKFNDENKIQALSIFKDNKIRMANLAIVGSHTVNGVAKIHSDLLKETIFKEFYELWPEKFQNKTNGVTHRRWIGCANPPLAKLYTEELGNKEWLRNMEVVKNLLNKLDDCDFRKKWNDIKQKNKRKLIEWIKDMTGIVLDENSIFDVQIKRIHEYKRQLMNALYVIYRYLKLKESSPEERKKSVPRSVLIGGKAAPGYEVARNIIRLIVAIAQVVNEDEDTKDYLKLVFLPNYSVTNAEVIIPGADITQNISTVGTEASGTSNMKFCMNGALLLGTMDGANVEIAEEVGEENMFIFGPRLEEIGDIKTKVKESKNGEYRSKEFNKAIEAIKSGMFGKHENIGKLIEHIMENTDEYLVAYDFNAYIEAQEKVDEMYKDREEWTKKSIITALNCSKFTSDRTVKEYAEEIWQIKPSKVPKPKEGDYEKWSIENRQVHTNDNKEEQQEAAETTAP